MGNVGRVHARGTQSNEEEWVRAGLARYAEWLQKISRQHDSGFHVSEDGLREALAWAVELAEKYLALKEKR
jgi:hypothetical protein